MGNFLNTYVINTPITTKRVMNNSPIGTLLYTNMSNNIITINFGECTTKTPPTKKNSK